MMTIAEAAANIGRHVIYDPGHGPEQGTIAGVSKTMVFVAYGPSDFAKATPPEYLTLLDWEHVRELYGPLTAVDRDL